MAVASAAPPQSGAEQEDPESGGGVEEQEQDCADLHCRSRRGNDRPGIRRSAAVPTLLPGEHTHTHTQLLRARLNAQLLSPGNRARRHGGGRTRHGAGGDNDAGEGARHQGDVQRRHARQHAVELQAAADGDLRKTSRSVSILHHFLLLLFLTHTLCPQVVPGETALAFYRAKNPTDKPIIGISTYNVVPFDAGQYFNKIQVINNQSHDQSMAQHSPHWTGEQEVERRGTPGQVACVSQD